MKKSLIGLAVSVLLLTNNVYAQDAKKMQEKINQTYPNLNVVAVEYLKDINLYELKIKDTQTLSYTNEANDFFIIEGNIVDVKNKMNYTKEREYINTQKFFNALPKEKAIVVKYGKGTRKIAVFTDPDCPYCRTLDKEIHTKLKDSDITFYYYMNPLTGIKGHEQSPLKAAKIWCSADKGKAWVDWMLNGVLPNNEGTCKNPVAETKQFATSVGFNSTPMIILDNGLVANQALSSEQILSGLKQRKQ